MDIYNLTNKTTLTTNILNNDNDALLFMIIVIVLFGFCILICITQIFGNSLCCCIYDKHLKKCICRGGNKIYPISL